MSSIKLAGREYITSSRTFSMSSDPVPGYCTSCEVLDYVRLVAGGGQMNTVWFTNSTLENSAYLEFVVSYYVTNLILLILCYKNNLFSKTRYGNLKNLQQQLHLPTQLQFLDHILSNLHSRFETGHSNHFKILLKLFLDLVLILI